MTGRSVGAHGAATLDADEREDLMLEGGATRGDILALGEPSDDELEIINRRSPKKLTRGDIYVADARPSDTSLDSYFTHMDAGTTLSNFAEDAADGVPILNNHGSTRGMFAGDLPIGRSITGQLIHDTLTTPRGYHIKASKTKPALASSFYLPRGLTTSTTSNDDIIRAIESAVLTDLSVTFGDAPGRVRGSGYWYKCDECGQDLLRSRECTHFPGMMVTTNEGKDKHRATATVMDAGLKEYSPVWRGANPGGTIPARMLGKGQELVAAGVLSEADVQDIDRMTGRHMASRIDWKAAVGDRRTFDMAGGTGGTGGKRAAASGQGEEQPTGAPTGGTADATNPTGNPDADSGRGTQESDGVGTGRGGTRTVPHTARVDAMDEALNGGADENAAERTVNPPDAGVAGVAGAGPRTGRAGMVFADLSAEASAEIERALSDCGITMSGAESPADAIRAAVAERGQLTARAADGDAFRAYLVELCHKSGVRAMGVSYGREVNERMLGALSVADLQDELERRNTAARDRFGSRDTPGKTSDELRERFASGPGGRQTQPAAGPLGGSGGTPPSSSGAATGARRNAASFKAGGTRADRSARHG